MGSTKARLIYLIGIVDKKRGQLSPRFFCLMSWEANLAITGDFFDKIQNKEIFCEEIHEDFFKRSEEMGVIPYWNTGCIQDAYFQWIQDLERVQLVEDKVRRPDHLKCAAHLIYWLRRSSPIDNFVYEGELTPSIEFMLKYGREYLALDLGYRIAQLYECKIHDRNLPDNSFSLQSNLAGVNENDFIETAVHVLKLKMVSPHSILLILKAIFLRP